MVYVGSIVYEVFAPSKPCPGGVLTIFLTTEGRHNELFWRGLLQLLSAGSCHTEGAHAERCNSRKAKELGRQKYFLVSISTWLTAH